MKLSGVRPSVRLSTPSFARRTPLRRFAAERRAGGRYRSTARPCAKNTVSLLNTKPELFHSSTEKNEKRHTETASNSPRLRSNDLRAYEEVTQCAIFFSRRRNYDIVRRTKSREKVLVRCRRTMGVLYTLACRSLQKTGTMQANRV